MRKDPPVLVLFFFILIVMLACSFPTLGTNTRQPAVGAPSVAPGVPADQGNVSVTLSPEVTQTPTTAVVHTLIPPQTMNNGKPVFDVESSGTASEKRAPYGDSYDINRLERPFLKDMTYIPDLDIETFSLGYDNDFYYLSIDLIGGDPNNTLDIQYGFEFDTNADGFGDYIIIARQPFSRDWTTANVKVFSDSNRDTAGLSGDKSDAPITTNGYDELYFDGGVQTNPDPDLAWVRINYSDDANVQFAIKKSLPGLSFMYGAVADGGLKDVGKLDYVDRYAEHEAGSPVKDKKYYPLRSLYAVDNTCREVFGFKPNGYEPMICPKDQPKPTNKPTGVPETPFVPPPIILIPVVP